MGEELKIYAGSSIEDAFQQLSGHDGYCYCDFNTHILTSDMSLDDMFLEVTGKTKAEYDKDEKARAEEYDRELEAHKNNIPSKAQEYIQKAQGIIDPKFMALWEEIVPIRLDDLYRGMELGCTLDIVLILNQKDKSQQDIFEQAKVEIEGQGHSGMSFGLMCGILRAFHDMGNEFVQYIKQ